MGSFLTLLELTAAGHGLLTRSDAGGGSSMDFSRRMKSRWLPVNDGGQGAVAGSPGPLEVPRCARLSTTTSMLPKGVSLASMYVDT